MSKQRKQPPCPYFENIRCKHSILGQKCNERYEIPDIKGRKHAVVLFSENRSEVRNGIPSTTMGFVAIDLDANTYKD